MRDEFFSDWLEYRRGNMERPDPADYEEPTRCADCAEFGDDPECYCQGAK